MYICLLLYVLAKAAYQYLKNLKNKLMLLVIFTIVSSLIINALDALRDSYIIKDVSASDIKQHNRNNDMWHVVRSLQLLAIFLIFAVFIVVNPIIEYRLIYVTYVALCFVCVRILSFYLLLNIFRGLKYNARSFDEMPVWVRLSIFSITLFMISALYIDIFA